MTDSKSRKAKTSAPVATKAKKANSGRVANVPILEVSKPVLARTIKPAPVRKPKLRRAEKAEANRKALIYAAVEVIGERGYNDTSIARITEKAGLAAGTFYLYFDSRQALFDILLPELAIDALQYISPLVHGSTDLVDLEERGLRGVLEWDVKNPGLARLRSEAEVVAPSAFETYLQEILGRYMPALKRGQSQGYLKGYDARELTVIAYMLMGARHYLHYSFGKTGKPPKWVVEAYIRFVKGGLLTFVGSAKTGESSAGTKVARIKRTKSSG